jgi:phosphatidylserine/phosphatidylglycerophosphate/cardiolipin synthase-like enzyme
MIFPLTAAFRLLQLSCFLLLFALSAHAQILDRIYDHVKGPPHLQMINEARKSIDIEIYAMKNTQILEALKRAMTRGVVVRIVQESNPVAESCQLFTPLSSEDDAKCVEIKKFLSFVRKKGGQYVPFSKDLCGRGFTSFCFQHGKLMITDSNLALISTGNFNASSFCDASENPRVCNRDYSVVTRDPAVVAALRRIFEADLKGRRINIEAELQRTGGQRLTVSPHSLSPLVAFIDSARSTIQIQNQYLKDPVFNAAIVRAARRGVKVFVMVASACVFGPPDQGAVESWTRIYSEFDAAGIHTKTFNASIPIGGRPGYLHSKAILVDGNRAWVGSVNGSTTSLSMNREYGLFSNDPQVVHDLGMTMYTDFMERGAQSWRESLKCKKDYQRPDAPDGH